MICGNCHREAGDENFCPYCGAPMGKRYCPVCGSPLPPDGRACYSCGWTARNLSQPAGNIPEPAPEVRTDEKGLLAGKREDPPAERTVYGAPRRTVAQTIASLVSGIVVLAACGVSVYLMLVGNMFAADGMALSPLTMLPATEGSFGIATNFSEIIDFFTGIPGMFSGVDTTDLVSLGMIVSRILIVGVYVFAAAVTVLATLFAVIAFIVGMARGRNFSMAGFAAVDFASVGMIWFVSRFGYYGYAVSAGSGTFTCLALAITALAACLLGNLVFAGARALRPGSLAKLVTNAAVCVAAFLCMFSFPFALSAEYAGSSAEVMGGAIDMAVAALDGGEQLNISVFGIVYMAALLILTVKYIFTLPFFASKTASRLAGTFKFDGYRDKGFVYRSLLFLIGAVLFAVFGIMYLSDTGGTPSTAFIVFCVSAAAEFVFALLARVFKDRDQL